MRSSAMHVRTNPNKFLDKFSGVRSGIRAHKESRSIKKSGADAARNYPPKNVCRIAAHKCLIIRARLENENPTIKRPFLGCDSVFWQARGVTDSRVYT